MKRIFTFFLLVPFVIEAQVDVSLMELADGFSNPCEIVNAGDERLFVVEQVGRINIMYPDGELESTPFLNIQSSVQSGGEMGLLGLAFPSDYCTSGLFYVNYTTSVGSQLYTHISRFSVSADDENIADPSSEEILMQYEQPYTNHNGGHIEFGPDGYLYIGNGDGGAANDPGNRAQNIMNPLGKMLRIDVSTEPYSIPEDNPFANDDFGMDEIWAYGLRNPWKFAFDDETGDLYIADVGQGLYEEVDFQPAGEGAGVNYGWKCYEGTEEVSIEDCEDGVVVEEPIYQYGHPGGRCSITGGRVYRGNSFPNLFGKYLFTDYCSDEYWLTTNDGGEWVTELGDNDLGNSIVSFGSDVWGEMYAISSSQGSVSRVLEAGGEWLEHIIINGDNQLESTLEGTSYQWFYNNEEIENSNSQIISFVGSGTYSLVITTASGCEVQTSDVLITSVGVESHPYIDSFEIFPNPAENMVNVELVLNTIPSKLMYLRVYSIEGKEVIQAQKINAASKNTVLNLESLKSGVYFVHLSDQNANIFGVEKLIVR